MDDDIKALLIICVTAVVLCLIVTLGVVFA